MPETHTDPAAAIFGEEHGAVIQSALTLLFAVPQSVFDDAARKIDLTRDFGCFTDPTAWIRAEATDNPEKWQRFARELAAFRRTMEECR